MRRPELQLVSLGVKGIEEARDQIDRLLSNIVLFTIAFDQGPQKGHFCLPNWQGDYTLPVGILPGNVLVGVGVSVEKMK